MNAREIAWAWGVAVFVAAIAVVAAMVAARPTFAGAPIAVVGTSVVMNAVPATGDALLGDGRQHRRLGVSAGTEVELLLLARRAVDERASLLLLEVGPFIRDFGRARDESCRNGLTALATVAKLTRLETIEAIRLAFGYRGWALRAEPGDLDQPHRIDPAAMAVHYPLHLREPACGTALAKVMGEARALNVRVVFMLLPRSATAHAVVGREQVQELGLRAAALAASFGVPLFDAGSAWPDAEFVDHAHVGRSGREHFARALRAWWSRSG